MYLYGEYMKTPVSQNRVVLLLIAREQKAFALVATISLLVLVALVCLGLLSLSSLSLRGSQQSEAQARAQTNARLALMMAIGDLQKYAGPDQRVTANADQLELTPAKGGAVATKTVNQPQWMGVWPTAVTEGSKPGFLVGAYDSGADTDNYKVDWRNPQTPNSGDSKLDAVRNDFNDSGVLGWLVSRPNNASISPVNFSLPPAQSEIVYGLDWSGDPVLSRKQVRVPTINVGNNASGRLAYWVSDEQQKANIQIGTHHQESDAQALAVSQTSPADIAVPALAGHQALTRNNIAGMNQIDKLITLHSAELLPLSGGQTQIKAALKEFGNDLTTDSVGLFTNTQTGGFQQDLSAFLAQSASITPSGYAASANVGFNNDAALGVPGLRMGDPIVQGPRHTATSPKFGALKGWADLAKVVSGTGANAKIPLQFPIMRSATNPNGDYGAFGGVLSDITKIAPQPVHPVMVECSLGWDFTLWPYPSSTTGDGMRVHLYPRVVLWNPYNITIQSSAYVALLKLPTYSAMTVNGVSIRSGSSSFYLKDVVGNPTNGYVVVTLEPTEIKPGQALVFTPSPLNRSDTLDGTAVPYDRANFAKNLMTARISPGPENFYLELRPGTSSASNAMNVFRTEAAGNVAGIPRTGYKAQYGFCNASGGSDSNYFYANGGSKSDQYVLKAIDGSVPATVDWNYVATNAACKTISYVIAQAAGYPGYDKWWDAKANDNAVNGGSPWGEYNSARNQPRLWRRGVRFRWFDDRAEYSAVNNAGQGTSNFNAAWATEYNVRPTIVHTSWLGGNGSIAGNGLWYMSNPAPYLMNWSPLANWAGTNRAVPDSSGNHMYSPFGPTSTVASTTSTFFEVPRSDTPIVSLAQFQNAALSYQSYHPSYIVANSYQDVRSERGATAVRSGKGATADASDHISNFSRWDNGNTGHGKLIQRGSAAGGGVATHTDDILLYDISFEVNNRLFDQFFLSSIPYGASGSNWNLETPLPNDRIRFFALDQSKKQEVKSKLSGDAQYGFNKAGSFLGNYGAFNVNSTSKTAWLAHLSGLRDLARKSVDGGTSSAGSSFSRLAMPGMASSGGASNVNDPVAWNGFRNLNDTDLANLADAIVREVKIRGPFVSLSDFVNRRLVEAPTNKSSLPYEKADQYSLEATGRMGALEAAIMYSGVNGGTTGGLEGTVGGGLAAWGNNERAFTQNDLNVGFFPYGAQPTYKTSGLPGYLSQGALLSAIAPTLTARGDTFKIRCYGEARDASGQKVIARAWCEAVVQRMPEYLDEKNDPAMRTLKPSSTNPSDSKVEVNNDLSEMNRRFGRKLEIVKFRWLQPSEV